MQRLYLPRNELGRGLSNVEHRSERMLLQLVKTLESNKELVLRRKAILKIEKDRKSHLANIITFLKCKYSLLDEVNIMVLESAQKSSLFSEIKKKVNHAKLYRLKEDPLTSIKESSTWLKFGNINTIFYQIMLVLYMVLKLK
jgi:hypothetical protein